MSWEKALNISPTTLVSYLKLALIAVLAVMVLLGKMDLLSATAMAVGIGQLLSVYGFNKAADAPPKADNSEVEIK
jgi:arginine exporter protein ArgO